MSRKGPSAKDITAIALLAGTIVLFVFSLFRVLFVRCNLLGRVSGCIALLTPILAIRIGETHYYAGISNWTIVGISSVMLYLLALAFPRIRGYAEYRLLATGLVQNVPAAAGSSKDADHCISPNRMS